MGNYKVTVFKPLSKDSTNPYVYESITANSDAEAKSKADMRIITRKRTDDSFSGCRIINIKRVD